MVRRKKRVILISALISLTAISVYLIMWALRDNIVFFYSPSEVHQKIYSNEITNESFLRLGGMVKENSIIKSKDGSISFLVTDYKREIEVNYSGIIPDLFREGQGVIAEGRLKDGINFSASSILAKHDENYMPPEVIHILDKNIKEEDNAVSVR